MLPQTIGTGMVLNIPLLCIDIQSCRECIDIQSCRECIDIQSCGEWKSLLYEIIPYLLIFPSNYSLLGVHKY